MGTPLAIPIGVAIRDNGFLLPERLRPKLMRLVKKKIVITAEKSTYL